MNKKTQETIFSSKSAEWETPQHLFDKLNTQYEFTLDPCCTKKTAKCKKYFTKRDNGLRKSWEGHTVFVNPPYGREVPKWVKKSYEESLKGDTTVVMLIPSRTDTRYWHDYCMKADELYFIKGRLKFGDAKNAAPFPSAVVVFGNKSRPPSINTMSNK